MSSPQPQMVAQQMTAEAPARVSSEQPRPVEPMSVDAEATNMRGGGEGVSVHPSFAIQSYTKPS
ncbi:hypothetical protein TRIATDRAFT_255974 [Trichoderma atroviride IMI 206040]|uniref:Uncharacterized protein n=1 Tax=Hypocrea atroviridis (strain ATCC 20476 / IMI 206040) TaxID=452589 RepID=G9NND6_HYPAI|nr:uncharacterized protein TRIATDRAFT_255974 [Trichoderma atroviride IMI 206040]EHK47583.1 hypothetical protein TRIATDRAFT_255974 [Trichoderma atroviride IMI 206040]